MDTSQIVKGKGGEMIYEIYCNGELIAKFKHQNDRDICIDALREEHDDCKWTT
jgi:hypothetical protein